MLTKPESVAADPFKSAKWDELTRGRSFGQSDAPALSLLCQWHKVAHQAMDELDSFGGNTAYQNDMGDLKAFPQIGTLKTASAEIRQLNRQLGITDREDDEGAICLKNGGSIEFSARSASGARRKGDMGLDDRITDGCIMDGSTYVTAGNCICWAESCCEKLCKDTQKTGGSYEFRNLWK